jgi:L-amino acid N-acyltransferase YncA
MKTAVIRETTSTDIPDLARLHVTTFNETHAPILKNGPSYEVREYQWRHAFQSADGSWFCFVIEATNGELIGFAKGQRYAHNDHREYAGELNKIYLLREYHRRGLGRRLLGYVARRFLSQGISSMLLFGDAGIPSNGFYEALGAEKLFATNGEFHGGYGWRDLRRLALSPHRSVPEEVETLDCAAFSVGQQAGDCSISGSGGNRTRKSRAIQELLGLVFAWNRKPIIVRHRDFNL